MHLETDCKDCSLILESGRLGALEVDMKRAFWIVGLLGIFILVTAAEARADVTLEYTLTEQGSSMPLATWEMSQTPTPSCPAPGPCFVSGEYFAEIVDISIDGAPATPDTLVFFNSMLTDVDLNDVNSLIPEFLGDQLYMNDESAPTMNTGVFTLTDDGDVTGMPGTLYTLNVAAMPEPGSLALVGVGVLAVGFGLRRNRAAMPTA